jgi:hypothetical protein
MYEYNVVIRWPNGDLEGFSGFGFDKHSAEESARQKVTFAQSLKEIKGKPVFLTEAEYKALTTEEKQELQTHWELSKRSAKGY